MMRCSFFMVVICCPLLVGCGGSSHGTPVTVKGKVSLDGKPVQDAQIIFHCVAGGLPAELRTVQSPINNDGTYTLTKVYPAEYMVQIQSSAPPDSKMASAVPPPNPLSKYGAESPLKAKVPSDSNEFNFFLTGS